MPKKKSVAAEGPSYEVECINSARVTHNKQWEYDIKWGGYPEEENSWEPEANLNGCLRMMTEFWQQVGPEHKAQVKFFPVDHTVSPPVTWINLQRKSYRKSQAKKIVQKKKQKLSRSRDSGRETASTSPFPSVHNLFEDESEDDDIPLSLKLSTGTRAPVAKDASAIGDAQVSSSKRKRDGEIPPESPSKRQKASFVDGRSAENVHADKAISDHDKESRLSPASSRDSLFGEEEDSRDSPLAAALSAVTPSAQSQPVQPQPTASLEPQQREKPKVPWHIQRKQNPRVKQLALPLLNTNLGGISTKNRILSQGNAKSAGPRNTVPDVSGPSGSRASPILVDSSDTPKSAEGTIDFDSNIWLKQNIMSKEQLARTDPNVPRPPAGASAAVSAPQLPRFGKRWRWTGQLAIGDNESGYAESVGGIVITDSTPLDRNIGNISVEALLPSHVDTLCLRHQYSLSMLQTVMRDFKISQFAVMTADRSDEESSFDDVVSYMAKHELFSQSSLTAAELEVATMFVFSSASLHQLGVLRPPEKVCQGKGLIVAFGFKIFVPPKQMPGGSVTTYADEWKTRSKLDLGSGSRSLDCNRALLGLNFPEALFKRLANKQCTIFTTPNDKDLPGHDSLALICVLKNAPGCKIVPLPTGSARLVFIHVGAWKMLHKLPGLVDRRLRRPDVQFYTYGSDPFVERKRWGVREVFPLGGIVTFTPRAIVEDPAGVQQLISKLDEHPLWACYVLPSVIPMVCQIAAENQNTINYVEKSGVEALCSIMLPIENGQVALTWQPPHRLAYDANSEPKWISWMVDQAGLSVLQGYDLFLECQKRFQRQQDRSEKAVEASIVKDLLVMQSELREVYRRFVIITDTTGPSNTSREAAASTSSSKADIKDGFELTHIKDFDFKDDYFAGDVTTDT